MLIVVTDTDYWLLILPPLTTSGFPQYGFTSKAATYTTQNNAIAPHDIPAV